MTPEERADALADALFDADCGVTGEGRELIASAIRSAEEEQRAAKDGAYAERNQVVALLARMALALGWRAGLRGHEPDPDPTWDDDWTNVVAIDLPTGQVTWHYHDSDRPLFASLPPYPAAWDGHDTPEKYRRVNAALKSDRGGR
jgi:hypothetical protein